MVGFRPQVVAAASVVGSFFVSFGGWVVLVVGLALVAVAVLFYCFFVHFLLLEGWWGTVSFRVCSGTDAFF